MKTLKGSVAVVTGAGSGIGRALAQELAAQGASLALADINGNTLNETRDLLGQANVKTYIVNVSEASAVEAFAQNVQQDFGRASLLINNAGVALFGQFSEITLDEFDWLFRINFWGVVYGCKFFLPLLRREADAHIVNISSVFGLIGPPGHTAYSASKFAVRGFSQALMGELQGTKVALTCVHPGGIRTNIAGNARAGAAARIEGWGERHERFHQLAQTSPEQASHKIIHGILRNKTRVLIGPDARQFDFLQRILPARSTSLLASWINRATNRGVQQSAPVKEPVPVKEKRGNY